MAIIGLILVVIVIIIGGFVCYRYRTRIMQEIATIRT